MKSFTIEGIQNCCKSLIANAADINADQEQRLFNIYTLLLILQQEVVTGPKAKPKMKYYPWNMPEATDCGECGCRGPHRMYCEGGGGTCRCSGYWARGQAETDRIIAAGEVYDANHKLVCPARPNPAPNKPPLPPIRQIAEGAIPAKHRSCNRHNDCDSADAQAKKALEENEKKPFKERAAGLRSYADHCYDSCCEDCFGA